MNQEAVLATLQTVGKLLTSEWYKRNEYNYHTPTTDQLQARFNSGLLAGINICCHLVNKLEQDLKEKDEDRTRQSTV